MILSIEGKVRNRQKLERRILEVYKKAALFFNFELRQLKVVLINDLNIICQLFNVKREEIPWYAVGFFKGEKIYICDKTLLKKRDHKENEFDGVLLHELCHIFIHKLLGKSTKVWVEEGLCQYLAFYNKKLKVEKFVPLKEINTYKEWYKFNHPYSYCSHFFYFLINQFGEKKIIEFLLALRTKDSEEAFQDVFNLKLNDYEEKFRSYLKNEQIIQPSFSL